MYPKGFGEAVADMVEKALTTPFPHEQRVCNTPVFRIHEFLQGQFEDLWTDDVHLVGERGKCKAHASVHVEPGQRQGS